MIDPFAIRIATLIAVAGVAILVRAWDNRPSDSGPMSDHTPRQGPMYVPGPYEGGDDDLPPAA